MVNYQDGKIYKVINDIDDSLYVGSTTKMLCQRLASHRSSINTPKAGKLHIHMKNLGVEHFTIILLESFPCENRDELRAREQYWKDNLKACLNMVNAMKDPLKKVIPDKAKVAARYQKKKEQACIDAKLYYAEHKEQAKAVQKAYRIKHAESLKAKKAAYRQKTKGKPQSEESKEKQKIRQKEYRIKNAEAIKATKKAWYDKRKDTNVATEEA